MSENNVDNHTDLFQEQLNVVRNHMNCWNYIQMLAQIIFKFQKVHLKCETND